MHRMLTIHLAHIVVPLTDAAGSAGIPVAAAIAACAGLLWFEHQWVLGGTSAIRSSIRSLVGLLCVVAVLGVSLPGADAQDDTGNDTGEARVFPGLPDLISDPMLIWFQKDVESALDGPGLRRVVAFEGSIHNIGEGSLDLFGNPQIPGGVKQRVFDGEEWTDVGAPTVEYETSDDHNHFHVMELAHYSLWNDGQTEQLGQGSKVGFCLTDVEEWPDAVPKLYDNDFASGFCGQDQPDLTELRMGISPGWADVYGPNITLQWVDITNVAPGRYWIGGVTDPNNEIVESDETNNGTVFSREKFLVRGWNALAVGPVSVAETVQDITLDAVASGTVSTRAFVIVDGPDHGELNVPIGVDLLDATVSYRPSPDFVGVDSFTYYAHDIATPFPKQPVIETVTLTIEPSERPALTATTPDFVQPGGSLPAIELTQFAEASTVFDRPAGVESDAALAWFARGLPHGLSIDQKSGEVTGRPTVDGQYQSEIFAALSDGTFAAPREVVWTVNEPEESLTLVPTNALSTATDEDVRLRLGAPRAGSTYDATDLPPGIKTAGTQPLFFGTPTDIGDYNVTVIETVDGEITGETSFIWTVRPSAVPDFPL